MRAGQLAFKIERCVPPASLSFGVRPPHAYGTDHHTGDMDLADARRSSGGCGYLCRELLHRVERCCSHTPVGTDQLDGLRADPVGFQNEDAACLDES